MEAIDTSQVMKIVGKDRYLGHRSVLEAYLEIYRKLDAMNDIELYYTCCFLRCPFPPPPFSEIQNLRQIFAESIPYIEKSLQKML